MTYSVVKLSSNTAMLLKYWVKRWAEKARLYGGEENIYYLWYQNQK
jgi:hypothetical protein